jgi:hypothetical protein
MRGSRHDGAGRDWIVAQHVKGPNNAITYVNLRRIATANMGPGGQGAPRTWIYGK